MNIAVIGAGYVGLVQAAGLTSLGHRVRVGEADAGKLETLRAGKVPFYESGLEQLLSDGLASGLLSFHHDNLEAVVDARVVFIALPTPQDEDGSADTSYIEGALLDFGASLGHRTLVVLKSTVPVGSVARFQKQLDDMGAEVVVLSNPEFLREGSAVGDFKHPDRIVVGTRDQQAAETMIELYQGLQAPTIVTDPASSEMIKYASNAYLAARITYANAIANLCEAVGADVKDVLKGMGYDRRIGFHFLNPGPGYGGSCFPKDTQALVAIAESAGYDFSLLKGVIEVNRQQHERMLDKVTGMLGGDVDGKRVAMWGLAFKAGTDDLRDSPAMYLATALKDRGAFVTAYDPQASSTEVKQVESAVEAARDAHLLLIATEWPEFQGIDMREVHGVMASANIVDARNMLDPRDMHRLQFNYVGVGR
ncbi:MAG: UDP-glucose/GDP-mannose dehydrogenase family protein [Acidimicrobiia bacterium]|nr:UDP-glucose/GDP-mannose dehydrogenase family protein [Acidimicrobiia bacterium]MBT8249115.1 UDP-glucose/GDP-mannose dehydrogenase family protein [Acidimicrobiia bacterium]NNL27287.1 UDP-glucose/GDP-mannose dehydrogenase family protein [Acidimicrobiia bacterium]